MESFTPVSALCGGALIGLSAALLLLTNGRIAGISGIVGGLLTPAADGRWWRAAFLGGLVAGAVLTRWAGGGPPTLTMITGAPGLVVAGVLVGVGTRVGNGCTSGHGVCGIARLSPRSLAATGTFMLTGALTVFVVRHVLGG
jgi:uncharacterized membrane protein YedE/YeeE